MGYFVFFAVCTFNDGCALITSSVKTMVCCCSCDCIKGTFIMFALCIHIIRLLAAGLIVGGISCVLTKALFAALPSSAGQQRKGSPFKN